MAERSPASRRTTARRLRSKTGLRRRRVVHDRLDAEPRRPVLVSSGSFILDRQLCVAELALGKIYWLALDGHKRLSASAGCQQAR